MRILSHFPAIGVSNTYVVGPRDGGDAILVDPGRFDVSLLELIENAGFYIRAVLISHDHWNHIQGLRTLLKIYNASIYAGNDSVSGFPAMQVLGGTCVSTAGMDVEVIDVEGHSNDSRVFKVGSYVFTGDILSAGRIGSSETTDSRGILIESIKNKLMSLDEDMLLLPGHGPPTTVEIERLWNPDLKAAKGPESP